MKAFEREPLRPFLEDLDDVLRDLGADDVEEESKEGEKAKEDEGEGEKESAQKEASFKLRLLGLAKVFDELGAKLREYVQLKPSLKPLYADYVKLRDEFLFFLRHLKDYPPGQREELFEGFKERLKKLVSALSV